MQITVNEMQHTVNEMQPKVLLVITCAFKGDLWQSIRGHPVSICSPPFSSLSCSLAGTMRLDLAVMMEVIFRSGFQKHFV